MTQQIGQVCHILTLTLRTSLASHSGENVQHRRTRIWIRAYQYDDIIFSQELGFCLSLMLLSWQESSTTWVTNPLLLTPIFGYGLLPSLLVMASNTLRLLSFVDDVLPCHLPPHFPLPPLLTSSLLDIQVEGLLGTFTRYVPWYLLHGISFLQKKTDSHETLVCWSMLPEKYVAAQFSMWKRHWQTHEVN